MPAAFGPRATPIARRIVALAVAAAVIAPIVAMVWVRTPWARGEHRTIVQPVPFSHPLHVTALGIDCRYCHRDVERSTQAGMPSTTTCVACHSAAMLATSVFAPVRHSLATDRPIRWLRVTQLPDFVYFDHAMHVDHGVACETCHGRIDQMPVVSQAASLSMHWCVECHRNPGPALRPLALVTAMGWNGRTGGDPLIREYRVRSLTNCSTCHR
ncbi:MAG TPA: cytochrome c3 family protein [Gemmatimonadales bacterium]|jgi:hypothetical protein